VRGVAEREEQAHRDRLGVELGQRVEVELLEHTVGPDPLAHADAALERDERLRVRFAEPVEVRARLPPQVQEMLEPGRGDERRLRPGPLEERIRRDRRPVREPLDRPRAHLPRGREHRLRLVGRGRYLGRREPVAVEEHGVGERPADVDAQDRHEGELREGRERS
jgi:hypothetical protein